MLPKATSIVAIIVLVFLIATPAQISRSPKDNMSPQLYSSMKSDSDKLDSLLAQHAKMMDKVEAVLPVISQNTEHLRNIDQRISYDEQLHDKLEARITAHERDGSQDPVSIAKLQTKVDGIADDMSTVKRAGGWLAASVGGLFFLGGGIVVRRYLGRNLPPSWAREESNHQVEYRAKTSAKLDEVKAAAENAYQAANTVNEKLIHIGVQVRDRQLLQPLHEEGDNNA